MTRNNAEINFWDPKKIKIFWWNQLSLNNIISLRKFKKKSSYQAYTRSFEVKNSEKAQYITNLKKMVFAETIRQHNYLII